MINPTQALSNFKEIYRLYQEAISRNVEDFISQEAQLILPLIPGPILCSLCYEATNIFQEEANMLVINSDITIVGDLHGQILDLFRILKSMGLPPERNYLFLGDFVDRGDFSTETITLILILKVLYPSNIFIIRGNHEFAEMFKRCGFSDELSMIYPDDSVINSFNDCFSYMPLAALINDSILCVHGGIGPSFNTLGQISNIKRPLYGFDDDDIITTIVWSDPSPNIDTFAPSSRGSGFFFGQDALSRFLQSQVLDLLVRGHESIDTGVQEQFDGQLVTVFSASNYCGMLNNQSGVLSIHTNKTREKFYFDSLPYFRRGQATFMESASQLVFIPAPLVKEPLIPLPTLGKIPGMSRSQNDLTQFRRASVGRRPSKVGSSGSFCVDPVLTGALPKRRRSTIDIKVGARRDSIKKSPSYQPPVQTIQSAIAKRKSIDFGRNAPSPRRARNPSEQPRPTFNDNEQPTPLAISPPQMSASSPQFPSTPQPFPSTPQPFPSTPQPFPSTSQPFPSTPQPFPSTPQPFPSTPQPFPSTSQPFPSTHQPFPSSQQQFSATAPQFPVTTPPFNKLQPVLPSYSRDRSGPRRCPYASEDPPSPSGKAFAIRMPDAEEAFPSFRKRNFSNMNNTTETK